MGSALSAPELTARSVGRLYCEHSNMFKFVISSCLAAAALSQYVDPEKAFVPTPTQAPRQQFQQQFQPQQQFTPTQAPRNFFPPGKLALNRFENGFNFDFTSQ